MPSPAKTFPGAVFVICIFVAVVYSARAEEYLSSLGNRWVDPGNPTVNDIGDIEGTRPGQYTFLVQFFTGARAAGTNTAGTSPGGAGMIAPAPTNVVAFQLDAVTYEFFQGREQPWSNISVQVYQRVGSTSNLVGELGNPEVNPTPTQWPQTYSFVFCTTYVDYHPISEIRLQPSSEYWLALSVPSGGCCGFGLLFSLYYAFATATDWQMGATISSNPWAAGEFLKVAISATAILDVNPPRTAVSAVILSVKRVGPNLVLSWPASTGPCQLLSTPTLQASAWTPVSLTPSVTNDNFVVTLPLSGPSCYFKLQAQ